MLVTNQRLDKLSAARVDFVNRGMLDPRTPQHPGAMQVSIPMENRHGNDDVDHDENEESHLTGCPSGIAQVLMVTGNVTLAQTRGMCVYYSVSLYLLFFL